MIDDLVISLRTCAENALSGWGRHRGALVNTGWLFVDKIVRLGIGLFLNVWIARYLGPETFGNLSYALSFVALFAALSGLGLDGVVVREIVRSPADRDEILGSAFALKLAGALVMCLAACAAISLVRSQDPEMRTLVAIVALGMIFQIFDVVDFWFQSQVQSRFAIYAKNSAFLAVSAAKVLLVACKAPLVAFAWAGGAEIMLGALGLLVAYRASGLALSLWRARRARCARLLEQSWPLILTCVLTTVYVRIDQLMLGEISGSRAVGVYSAAASLSELWYFIPLALASSFSPAIIKLRDTDPQHYYQSLSTLFTASALIAYCIVIPMTFFANYLVLLLFGPDFVGAGTVLALHIWNCLFVFLGIARSIWIIAEGATKVALLTSAVGALTNVLLNLYLIPKYGPLGAALATVLSYALADYGMFLLVPSLRKVGSLMTDALLLNLLSRRNRGLQ